VRRRTKPRVVWLPNTNANSVAADNRNGIQFFFLDIDPLTAPFRGTAEIPVVIDGEPNPLAADQTLSDVENSGYRIRRIVGKIFVGRQQDTDAGSPFSTVVTAGLIVRRINPETGASLASLNATGFLQDPQDIENWGDPWIWRRSWWMCNGSSDAAPNSVDIPFSNMECGSVADGPHVDVKCARIVSSEERLFLNVTAQIPAGQEGGATITASHLVITDLRVLASMRTSTGNRRNASR